ncbi:MAG: molybdenum cofactor guanylyltransferase, partial [Candidatus Dormibacteraceae bacterium]
PCAAGRPQPTCAVYARASAPALTAALERGERRLIPVVASLDVVWVEGVDERALTNLNTPADVARLLAEVQREPAPDERP